MKIELRCVTYEIQGNAILDNLSHIFPSGCCTLITGDSGSGKSTLIKTIAGLIAPSSGEVFVDDADFTHFKKKQLGTFRKNSGFLFQDSALWANRSLWENMALPLQYHYPDMSRADIEITMKRLTDYFELTDNPMQRPAQSSQGEQKLYSLIRSVIHKPETLFLDQPFGSIDDDSKKRVHDYIVMLKEEGRTLIISSNNREKLEDLADEIIQIKKDGKLVSVSGRNST